MDYVLKQTITSNDYSKDNSMQEYAKTTKVTGFLSYSAILLCILKPQNHKGNWILIQFQVLIIIKAGIKCQGYFRNWCGCCMVCPIELIHGVQNCLIIWLLLPTHEFIDSSFK